MFKYLKWNDFVKSPVTFRVCSFGVKLNNRGERTGWKEEMKEKRPFKYPEGILCLFSFKVVRWNLH